MTYGLVQPLGWGLVAVVMGLVSLLLFNSGRSSSCFACLFAFVGGAFVTTLNREYATGAPPADYMKYDAVVMSTPQRHGKVVGFDALVVDVADRRVSPFMAKVSIAGLDTCRLGIGSGIEALSVFTVPGQRKDSKIPVQRKAARAPERRFDYSRYLQTQGFRAQTFVYASDMKLKQISATSIPMWHRKPCRYTQTEQSSAIEQKHQQSIYDGYMQTGKRQHMRRSRHAIHRAHMAVYHRLVTKGEC